MDSQHLSKAFVELADTLVGDFDALDSLHVLTTRCTQLLNVTAAGVLLADPAGDLRVMGASSEQVRLLELFQLQNDQGPCLDCYRSGHLVSMPDLSAAEARWPRFTPEARRRGFTAVVVLPMRLRQNIIGAMNLFNTGPGLDLADIQIAQALADVATIGILQHRAQRQTDTVVTQLQTALDSRVFIEQAKGILAERLGIGMDEAFNALRGHARAHHRHLTALAQAVVAGTEDVNALSGRTRDVRPPRRASKRPVRSEPWQPGPGRLTLADREEISLGLRDDDSFTPSRLVVAFVDSSAA